MRGGNARRLGLARFFWGPDWGLCDSFGGLRDCRVCLDLSVCRSDEAWLTMRAKASEILRNSAWLDEGPSNVEV